MKSVNKNTDLENQINELALSLNKCFVNHKFAKLSTLLNDCSNIITRSVTRKFYSIPLNFDDFSFIQNITLWKSINFYKKNNKYCFSQLYCTRLRCRLYDYIRPFLTLGEKVLNVASSFTNDLQQIISFSNYNEPEENVKHLQLKKLINSCLSLSLQELKLFWLKFSGYSNNELCNFFLMDNKKLDNSFQKVKKDLRCHLRVWN